jgi:two-component system phosphate regulon response regulator PhoB
MQPATIGTDRILIVDDEPDIVELTAYHLAAAGYQPITALTGQEAIEKGRMGGIALVLLDLMLPDMSGFDVMTTLRADPGTGNCAFLMLTALREDADRIKGLSLGADDYLTKPFNPDELVLRIAAILRRARAPRIPSEADTIGPIVVDRPGHRVSVRGVDVGLTPTEYRLLLLMVDSRGLAQRREHLLQAVWGAEPDMQTRTVDVHIQRLRTKLGSAGQMIETVRGYGYRLSAENSSASAELDDEPAEENLPAK